MPPTEKFFRPCWVEVHHGHLQNNFKEILKQVPHHNVLAVVKANAYGHGLVPAARTLSKLNPKFFGITSIEEALQLKRAGIKVPSLILGNIFPFSNLEHAIKNNVRVTVASAESAKMCDHYAKKLRRKVYAHAKIDTGMSRIGVSVAKGREFIRMVREFKHIEFEGIYTHFSGSAEDPAFTQKQIELFSRFVRELKSEGISIPYIHCANSAGIYKYRESHFSLVRPGISLYGIMPMREHKIPLNPVLTWKSRIVFLKDVPSGTPVSYAGTFITKRPSRIATAAFGYADGFRRSFSNKAQVLVGGSRAPVLGRVTMDMTMLDVTDIPGVRVGDEVVILGRQGKDNISVWELADWAETSPYEIFCGISLRVPRVDVR